MADTTSPIPPGPETPVGETSILLSGPHADLMRRRMERPARAGRLILILIGSVTAAAGIATWVTSGELLGLAIAVFGAVLLALGVIQHTLYLRDQVHWPDQAYVWTDGLELVLHNGEVRGASWSDPDFGLQLVARRSRPPVDREYLLIWLMDAKVPPVELSADGFDQVRQRAADHGLDLAQTRRGARADSMQLIHVRPSKAALAAALATPGKTTKSD